MRRVAAIYDIHGNLPALESVLAEVDKVDPDLVLVGGDVLPGPMPRQTLERLQGIGRPIDFIRGNGEMAVLDQMAGREPTAVSAAFRPVFNWCALQISPGLRGFIESWPRTRVLEIEGLGKVLFCHATPRDENEIFTERSPEEAVLPAFDGVDADVIVCGHTHMQFDRQMGPFRVVNAGSVGSAFGPQVANWMLLGPSIEFHATEYDLDTAANEVRATGYPLAEEFLRPRSAEEMVEFFTRMGLR